MLFEVVKECWREEQVPKELVKGVFVPLYKNKGSQDDKNNYRFVCLLPHSYKLLACVLLRRLVIEVEDFMPWSQCGFRAGWDVQTKFSRQF